LTVSNETTQELIPVSTSPTTLPRTGEAAVYRYYDGAETLLYIGSTVNPSQRWSSHKGTKGWWGDVASYTLTWWPSAEEAYAEEYKAIRAEQPKHNQLGVFPFGQKQPLSSEAQRVAAAMTAVEEIEDPEHRARVIGEVSTIYSEFSSRGREMRRATVVRLRGEGVSYRKIATILGVSLGTVQDIERGHSGSWGTKPRRKAAAE
jgi:DNA-binding transcriptional regulator YiaG/predicted GIY-YIG superfamily endonuclease